MSDKTIYESAEIYELFYGDYRQDIPFYTEAATSSGEKVLEIACGTGRIYLELLKKGIDAYGIDTSEQMLAVLERKAAALKLQPKVQLGDMRCFKFKYKFSLIMIPFRGFLNNLTTADQIKTLKTCRSHLATGGKLILNFFYPDPEFIVNSHGKELKNLLNSPEGPFERITKYSFVDEPDQIFEVTETLKKRDTSLSVTSRLALVYKREFILLLRLAGFKKWQVYGWFDRRPLTSSKQEMVWVIEN